jgi:hypothetical protein
MVQSLLARREKRSESLEMRSLEDRWGIIRPEDHRYSASGGSLTVLAVSEHVTRYRHLRIAILGLHTLSQALPVGLRGCLYIRVVSFHGQVFGRCSISAFKKSF